MLSNRCYYRFEYTVCSLLDGRRTEEADKANSIRWRWHVLRAKGSLSPQRISGMKATVSHWYAVWTVRHHRLYIGTSLQANGPLPQTEQTSSEWVNSSNCYFPFAWMKGNFLSFLPFFIHLLFSIVKLVIRESAKSCDAVRPYTRYGNITRRLKCHCNITFYCVAEKGKDTTAAATESFCLCTSLVS